MLKQVSGGQDGGDLGIGNPLGGQKHVPAAKRFKGEKGKEKVQGAGCEMVVGDGVATRSVSRAKNACQDRMSSSESDEELFKMFKEWAIRHERNYKTADEEKERFNIWCATKERIDGLNSRLKPGEVRYRLNVFADMTLKEYSGRYLMRPCVPIPRETPTLSDKKVAEHNKMEEEKKEAEEEEAFDKWVAEQKRKYGNELEREVGFTMYRTNTRWIKSLLKEEPGKYSTALIDLGILLDQVMTVSEFRSLLYGVTQNIIGSAVKGGLSSYNRSC